MRFLLFFCLFLLFEEINSQSIVKYTNDTNIYVMKEIGVEGLTIEVYNFIDSLTDGSYILLGSENNDFYKEGDTLIKGEFINGKKQGLFKYYINGINDQKSISLVTYEQGIREGSFYLNIIEDIDCYGNFKNNEIDGLFHCYSNGDLIAIYLFKEAQLVFSYGINYEFNIINYENYMRDTIEVVKKTEGKTMKLYYFNDKLIMSKTFDSSNTMIEKKSGDFYFDFNYNNKYSFDYSLFRTENLKSGVIEIYKDGKIVEKHIVER